MTCFWIKLRNDLYLSEHIFKWPILKKLVYVWHFIEYYLYVQSIMHQNRLRPYIGAAKGTRPLYRTTISSSLTQICTTSRQWVNGYRRRAWRIVIPHIYLVRWPNRIIDFYLHDSITLPVPGNQTSMHERNGIIIPYMCMLNIQHSK